MPPLLALAACLAFTLSLLVRDGRKVERFTAGGITALIWFSIIASKPVSVWIDPMGEYAFESEGSTLDRNIYLCLMIVGIYLLSRRKIDWGGLLANNKAVLSFALFALLSLSWSDFPEIGFKRWVKLIGMLVMVLLLVTERDPGNAVRALVRRAAYVLVPLSIVFIKYFPLQGRRYAEWTGELSVAGVAYNKNALGYLCLLVGLMLVWSLILLWKTPRENRVRGELGVLWMLLLMLLWLFNLTDSATSTACFVLGCSILWALSTDFMRAHLKNITLIIVATLAVLLVLQLTIDLQTTIIRALGRDVTLTGRTELWNILLGMVEHPYIGTGWGSFWLGERFQHLAEIYWWKPTQAHNGYLETYLNLGWIGVSLLGLLLLSTYRKVRRSLVTDPSFGMLRFAFFIVAIVFNYTEAAFRGLHPMWFLFLAIAVEAKSAREQEGQATDSSTGRVPDRLELVARVRVHFLALKRSLVEDEQIGDRVAASSVGRVRGGLGRNLRGAELRAGACARSGGHRERRRRRTGSGRELLVEGYA